MLRNTIAAISLAALSTAASATTLSLTAGVDDNFAAPSDVASPSAALATAIAAFAEAPNLQNFDLTLGVNGGAADRQVAHTFTGLPTGITAASLTFRVRAGTDSFTFTDGIALSFVKPGATDYKAEVAAVYSRAFGGASGGGSVLFAANDPGLFKSAKWNPGDEQLFTLDLAALPLASGGSLNLLSLLNSNGFLDVNVSDDSAADFFRLDVTAVPLPAAIFQLLPGLFAIGAGFRRRG